MGVVSACEVVLSIQCITLTSSDLNGLGRGGVQRQVECQDGVATDGIGQDLGVNARGIIGGSIEEETVTGNLVQIECIGIQRQQQRKYGVAACGTDEGLEICSAGGKSLTIQEI